MATSAELKLLFTGVEDVKKSTDAVKRELGNVQSAVRSMDASIQRHSMSWLDVTKAIGAYSVAAAGITAAFDGAKGAIIGFNSALEQAQVSFKVMTGSADTARRHLQDLKAFATQTPFEFPELLEASKRLQAYGTEVKDVIPLMTTLGNITAGVGKDKLPQLILAFGQVQAATKLTGTELRQFTEAGVPLLDALAKAYNRTAGEIQEMVSEGKIGADAVRYVLDQMAGEGGKFANLMAEQSRTFEGAMSNIKDSANFVIAEGFEPLFKAIRDASVDLADLFTKDGKEWSKTLRESLTTVGSVIDAQLISPVKRAKKEWDDLTNYLRDVFMPTAENAKLAAQVSETGLGATRGFKQPPSQSEDDYMAQRERSWVYDAALGVMVNLFTGEMEGTPVNPALPKPGRGAPPPLRTPPPAAGGGGARETTPDVERFNAATAEAVQQGVLAQLAYAAWREEIKKLVADGNLELAAEQYRLLGKDAKEAIQDILADLRELEQERIAAAREEAQLAAEHARDVEEARKANEQFMEKQRELVHEFAKFGRVIGAESEAAARATLEQLKIDARAYLEFTNRLRETQFRESQIDPFDLKKHQENWQRRTFGATLDEMKQAAEREVAIIDARDRATLERHRRIQRENAIRDVRRQVEANLERFARTVGQPTVRALEEFGNPQVIALLGDIRKLLERDAAIMIDGIRTGTAVNAPGIRSGIIAGQMGGGFGL